MISDWQAQAVWLALSTEREVHVKSYETGKMDEMPINNFEGNV